MPERVVLGKKCTRKDLESLGYKFVGNVDLSRRNPSIREFEVAHRFERGAEICLVVKKGKSLVAFAYYDLESGTTQDYVGEI